MQRLQAFKFELMPDGQQQRLMRRFAGSCRFVFNKALALQKERYEQGEKKLSYAELCKQVTAPRRKRRGFPLLRPLLPNWQIDAGLHG